MLYYKKIRNQYFKTVVSAGFGSDAMNLWVKAYLATRTNHSVCAHTPNDGSRLNLVETLSAKLARAFLRGYTHEKLESNSRSPYFRTFPKLIPHVSWIVGSSPPQTAPQLERSFFLYKVIGGQRMARSDNFCRHRP